MTKRTDTQPMLLPPTADPTNPGAPPDLGQQSVTQLRPAATTTKRTDTQPMFIPPAVDQTIPGAPPDLGQQSVTPAPTNEELRETERLLESFNRPLQPPAPRPKQQASSDGGDFVAYSSVSSPARRSAEETRRLALVEIANLAAAPDSAPPEGPLVAERRDFPTVMIRPPRGFSALQKGVAGAALLVAIGATLAVVAIRPPSVVPTEPPTASHALTASVTAQPLPAATSAMSAAVPAPPAVSSPELVRVAPSPRLPAASSSSPRITQPINRAPSGTKPFSSW